MKKLIAKSLGLILACLLLFGIAGCTSEKTNDASDATVSPTDNVLGNESATESGSKEMISDVVTTGIESTIELKISEPVKPNEESETGTGGGNNSEPPKELPEVSGIFADYADDSELGDDSLLFDEDGYTLVKIRVTKEVKNFKFITVIDDGPHAGETLFEVASLTPDRPFYARTTIGEGFSERGISYVNENGETVYCRIEYDGRGGSGFGLVSIPGNPDGQG